MLYEMIMKPEHPGYYAFVLAGETSLGEYWEENPRSHNHDMLGHIMEWIYNGLAGIRPVAPGFSQVSVKPWLPESMNRFKCSYNTPFGKITVEGKRVDGEAKFEISVPDGITLKD